MFKDGRSARPLVEGTVPRGYLRDDEAYYTGRSDGKFVKESPKLTVRQLCPVLGSPGGVTEGFLLSAEPADPARVLERGRERYMIYCAPCHAADGVGKGLMVEKKFPQGASFMDHRLLSADDGYYYHVITNGFGNMAGMNEQLKPEDRWAIVRYVRELQGETRRLRV